jgi:hypothetical protein
MRNPKAKDKSDPWPYLLQPLPCMFRLLAGSQLALLSRLFLVVYDANEYGYKR